MAVDCVATLQEQADLVMDVAKDVDNALAASDLTVEQASRLYNREPKTSIGLSNS
ncbi:hypothetical protein [Phyllobacterium zundukense]|uniref:Uncharacterized protein n=1 Tax=Phyllobacterium zundukense TaxID=1867719 RepID=A0ACD4CZ04_9HYPH|nr:hypothetical protein [Phyllobacterium zundukense]UXN58783.1 hypothetical protein N8E88_07625 [Phyllobacterium zundukense]